MHQTRIDKIRSRLAKEGVDALLVTAPANVRYLSGFTSADGLLLITAERAFLATDFRYFEQVERQAPDAELFKVDRLAAATYQALFQTAGARRVAFESSHVTYAQYQELASARDVELAPIQGWVEALRGIKSPGELALIRRAIAISDSVIAALPQILRPGMSERQLAWEIEAHMRTHGAEGLAFPVIAAGGPNSALPHAVPAERTLVPGEPIVLDLGARVDGYCSDLTRTVCIGQPDERFREIHAIVLAAQQAAEAAIRPGMLGKEADAIARQVITNAGYGQDFGHGLGHALGLEIHESPRAGLRSEDRLEPGVVITVEPGIYLPGWGGIRIEDVVLVTANGVEILTGASKDPIVAY